MNWKTLVSIDGGRIRYDDHNSRTHYGTVNMFVTRVYRKIKSFNTEATLVVL